VFLFSLEKGVRVWASNSVSIFVCFVLKWGQDLRPFAANI